MASESSIFIHRYQQHHKHCVWAKHQPFILQLRVSPSCASSTTHQGSDEHHVFPAFEPLHPLHSLSLLSLSLPLFFSILEKDQTLTLR